MQVNPPSVGAVLLGAGFSRRFGADKRLQPLRGTSVAEQTCTVYAGAFEHLRVVIRPEDQSLHDRLYAYTHDIVTCADAHLGMGHSLAAAISGLTWQWAFVGLLDMPFIRTETLRTLINHSRAQTRPAILRPRFKQPGKDGIPYGHPIGWHKSYFAELSECRGDVGARDVLKHHHADVVELELDDPGILQDIDTPADLKQ